MAILWLDIETYSGVDLKKSNVYRYVADPDWMILFTAYAWDDDPVQVSFDQNVMAQMVWEAIRDGHTIYAHNAAFERINFSAALGCTIPGDYLDPAGGWMCTQALAGEYGYPQKLEHFTRAMGGEVKDTAGTRLINLFSKPNRQGKRTLPEEKPEDWALFVEYGIQDVVSMRDAAKKLPSLEFPTEAEYDAWVSDQIINDQGVRIDARMARLAEAQAERNGVAHKTELQQLTGLANPNSIQQLGGWLAQQGVPMPDLTKETVQRILDEPAPEIVHKALELRQELALVASKKYTAALDRINTDARLRGGFQFFGAHTGRWAGRGIQFQNMPSATIVPDCYAECKAAGLEDDPIHGRHIDTAIEAHALDLKLDMGADAHTLKALVRSMLWGPFTVVDYSAIEARVIAWLAGEQWALDAFSAGRDIYVETAERMGQGMTRKEGKVAVLALGYNGGIGSLRAMGAEGTDEYMSFLVRQWRDANPNIVELWGEMDEAFRKGGPVGQHIEVIKDGADRWIRLPSGRAIGYHQVQQKWGEDRWGRRKLQISFADPNPLKSARTGTYGGRLTENVTQAIARDLLAYSLTRLQDAGYTPVAHVHDEIIVEGYYPVGEIAGIMTVDPGWAGGLPLSAEGYTCPRYRKG